MKLFVIGSAIPCPRANEPGVTAVHIVTYELLRALQELGHALVFQVVFNRFRTSGALSASERQALADVTAIGVDVLPPMYPQAYAASAAPGRLRGRLGRRVRRLSGGGGIEDYYAASSLREQMRARIRASGANGVLTVWSPEGIAATHGFHERPKIAYHGDPDFHPMEIRMRDRSLFPMSPLQAWRTKWWLQGFRRAHLALMRDTDVIANIMAANADFYARQGHPRSVYIRSLWSQEEPAHPRSTSGRPIKIIGHAGNLGATGGTYGLKYLLVDLMPRLDAAMAGVPYEVHIFGAGQVVPSLQPRLQHPRIVVRGFVDDYAAELRSSDVFLLLNNAGPYQGAHTRQIIAWSMGLCLVAHANSRQAIPEIRHLENALLGSTPEDIAGRIRLASTDVALNQRLRQGGWATYQRHFRPRLVAGALVEEFMRLGAPAPSTEDAVCVTS